MLWHIVIYCVFTIILDNYCKSLQSIIYKLKQCYMYHNCLNKEYYHYYVYTLFLVSKKCNYYKTEHVYLKNDLEHSVHSTQSIFLNIYIFI